MEHSAVKRGLLLKPFEYKIYRKKFLGIMLLVVFLSMVIFYGVSLFFTTLWAGQWWQSAQESFWNIERKVGVIKEQVSEYVDNMYTSRAVMMDAKALFAASNEADYIKIRAGNSDSMISQIVYLPAQMRRLFSNSRLGIRGITMVSESGIKAIWLERYSGDMKLIFGISSEEQVKNIVGFGDVCLVSFKIRDPDSISKQIGTIHFWVNKRDIFIDPAQRMGSFAAVQGGEVLNARYIQKGSEQWLNQAENLTESQGAFYTESHKQIYYMRSDSNQYKYTYLEVIDQATLWRENKSILYAILIALATLVIGVILVSYIQMRQDSRFLTDIMQMLSAMAEGDFSVADGLKISRQNRQNEYGRIALEMKNVSHKLEGHIETEYILKLKQKEAAMRALQQQINPHFLYNSLETIRSRALVQEDAETAAAIEQLGKLYRARVHSLDVISLKEEFELLKMYLRIMELRFSENFVYQVELEPEVEKIQTVTFWLQPLAENFFMHGFDRDSEFNLLIVDGHMEKNGVRIDMTDNGSGIEEEKLEEIRKNMLEGRDDARTDIGIRNVYMRLSYFYKERFQMEVSNNQEGGAHISVFIQNPCERGGGGECSCTR